MAKIMNKILREEMEYLITCDDKAITPDVRDDVEMTLKYIDELEDRIDKAIEYIEELYEMAKEQDSDNVNLIDRLELILKILRGEDNE